ncbi:MAG: adenosine deaminase [Chloroflexi bacterium]|nr:adenosine deaminase [Chloroflexota bacterium]
MNLADFIRQMPKTELHVHLEGAVQPATLLALAEKNGITLPVRSEAEIRDWYRFTDFDHFIEIYLVISSCIRTPDDLELVAREFLRGQAAQNIVYSEVIFTPYTHYLQKGMPFADQLAAIRRAVVWGRGELGIDMGIVVDIDRQTTPEQGITVADWAIGAQGDVIALGLGGAEVGNPPQKHQPAFDRAYAAGLPALPHAGETEGPASIWGALDTLHPRRILHGVRCVEDPALVERLRDLQIPLDVCPVSNICLNVFPSIADHPLPYLLDQGLFVTINSDDPPMFNTSLTNEYLTIAETFGFGTDRIQRLVMNGITASLLGEDRKRDLATRFEREFAELRGSGNESQNNYFASRT